MSDTKGKFSSLPPSSAAIAGHHLLESQNALTNASLQKRELAKETTGIMGDVRLKLADAIKESITKDAQKQFVSGGMAIGGGIVSGVGAGYSANEQKKASQKTKGLEDMKQHNLSMVDMLKNPKPKSAAVVGPTGLPTDTNVRNAMNDLKAGAYPIDPKSTGYNKDHLEQAADLLKKQDAAATPGTPSGHSAAVKSYKEEANRIETEINSIKSESQSTVMTANMIKDGVNGVLVQGTTGIVGGVLDLKKADIDYNKVLRELTNQQLTEDRRLFTENASKYQGDGSKSLDLLNQIRANNRYG